MSILLGVLVGLIGGGIALAIKRWDKQRRIRERALADSKALGYRVREQLADYNGQLLDDWPVTVPPELEDHDHTWNMNADCLCGAHLNGGVVYHFTRGQTFHFGNAWHRVVMRNVMGCGHWVLDGFPDVDDRGDTRHFTSDELMRAMRGEEVNVDD